MKIIPLKELLNRIETDYKVIGNQKNKGINNFKTILTANKNSLVWINPSRRDKQILLEKTKAQIIICDSSLTLDFIQKKNKCLIIVNNPKLIFSRLVNIFSSNKILYGIHRTSIIHKDAKIHSHVFIGPNSYIGKCIIQEGAIIYGNCYLYDNTHIGKNVVLHAGVIIGCDGFGYAKNEFDEYEKFPHLGGVIIEDNVEIGANTCIDKGALGDTIIKSGTKIDNLVHIAHNSIIGKNCIVVANSVISGSTEIGDNTWISPSVTLKETIKITKGAMLGIGSVILNDVNDKETRIGNPAITLKEYIKQKNKLRI